MKKIITRNGEGYVALVDARKLDFYHHLEREYAYLMLLNDTAKGWEDVKTGSVISAAEFLKKHGLDEHE
jgi:hypothetical protein